ncbi:hypothetical protein [Tsukamurella paurometabola]|uniref:Helix-turn-helix domain-containing protein n=1 Tax=Tsukamurella paurometabola TaxID=2061 RepID=A0ABS5NDU2_TSUPA|nr:hypothetical protein [Tsukamurella paurometabola]MBS4102434.1 hypothetical protein [Tsukamurella paurometabola]
MSLRTAQWAMYESGVQDALAHRILGIMVDIMDGDGKNFFRSQAWIADNAYCSVATVKRKLKELETLGVIARGDQSILDEMNWPADRRPVVWDAVLGAVAQNELPGGGSSNRDETVAQTEHERQLTGELQNSPYTPQTLPNAGARKSTSSDDFDTWWPYYPRKAAKGQARTAFVKAMKKTDLDTLIAATKEFANIREKQIASGESKPEFTPYPSTWLNGERWEEFSPKQSQDVLVEFLAEHSFAELERATGIRCMTPEFGELEFGERREAVRVFRERWLDENRDRLAEALR